MSDDAFSKESINHDVGLLDKQTHRVFNDKLTFKYVEIAKFNKKPEELSTNFDKWLYVLKNLSRLDRQPKYLQNQVFNRLFEETEIAHFTRSELREYEDSLKAYRDIQNSLNTAKEEGRSEGLAEGLEKGRKEGLTEGLEKGRTKALVQLAKNLLKENMPIEDIARLTGTTVNEIKELLRNT